MLSASLFLIISAVATQVDAGDVGPSSMRFYYASRLIGALLLATVVPLLIDRRAHRSNRARQ
jgi:hypothetical protein